MQETEFIWQNGEMLKWKDAQVHILTHALHYGTGVFEGVRAYKTEKGTAVFKLKEHMERLIYSAHAIEMEIPFSVDELCNACIETVRINNLESGYIRPVAFYGYGKMGINPEGASIETAIACWPWGKYIDTEAADIKISKYCRIAPETLKADAKISGHYVNSLLAVLEVRNSKYHEALLLDTKGFIAEGPGENVFLVKNGVVSTPETGTILPGITRSTVIKLCASMGYEVQERRIKPEELFEADEAFFTGTAAEVTPIRSVDDKPVGQGRPGPISEKVRDQYFQIVHGRNEKYLDWLSFC